MHAFSAHAMHGVQELFVIVLPSAMTLELADLPLGIDLDSLQSQLTQTRLLTKQLLWGASQITFASLGGWVVQNLTKLQIL